MWGRGRFGDGGNERPIFKEKIATYLKASWEVLASQRSCFASVGGQRCEKKDVTEVTSLFVLYVLFILRNTCCT